MRDSFLPLAAKEGVAVGKLAIAVARSRSMLGSEKYNPQVSSLQYAMEKDKERR